MYYGHNPTAAKIQGFLSGSEVNNLPVMQEIWVQSLGQEDSLEEGMARHSSILAWRIPWTKKIGGLQSMVSQRVQHDITTMGISRILTE